VLGSSVNTVVFKNENNSRHRVWEFSGRNFEEVAGFNRVLDGPCWGGGEGWGEFVITRLYM
jgi:hypothetical protein